jgi:predicted MPP superfamily phosphohydrolase
MEHPTTLVFVHLSDLHFRESGSPLSEREQALRDRLLDDIPKVVALVAGEVEAILITGDLARSGQRAEYQVARGWLDELCARLGISHTKTLTCPGNHDVDWSRLDAGRLAINEALRTCKENLIDGRIDLLLKSEPDMVLAPLENYQEFAAGSACDIEKCLAWDLPPIPFSDGYALAIRGANTVLNSDRLDGEGTMAVQTNQMIVRREPDLVRMLLLHHSPAFWRRPKPGPAQFDQNLVLYGHTHTPDHKVSATCLEITAGAIHPEEQEDFAIPSYNVIEISIEEEGELAYARVRVFHREFSREHNAFIETDGSPDIDERVEILHATRPKAEDEFGTTRTMATADASATVRPESLEMNLEAETQPPLKTETGQPDPSRLVRSAFERLGAGDRLRLLDRVNIPRADISGLPPHRQIREVARRVVEDGLVEQFLTAASEIGGH